MLATVLIVCILFAGSIFGQSNSRKSYAFHSRVEKVNRKSGTLTVNADEVEGWMPVMTLQYRLDNPGVLNQIKAGTQIESYGL
ncbi:MAG TPA: copper-binding protein [Bryobacteraceae bacterium]|nr:copper-binding protein [Bryobacteraceae bacterium]